MGIWGSEQSGVRAVESAREELKSTDTGFQLLCELGKSPSLVGCSPR